MLWLIQCFSTINGRIDQVNQLLELDHQKRGGARYAALDKWTNQLNSLNQAIVSKLAWVTTWDPENSPFTRHPDGSKGFRRHKLLSGPKSPDHWTTWSVRLNWLVCVMQLLILKPQQLYESQTQKCPKKICCSESFEVCSLDCIGVILGGVVLITCLDI